MKRQLSLHGRMLVAALLVILLTLSLTAWTIDYADSEVVVTNLNAKLDAQISLLEMAMTPEHRFKPANAKFFNNFGLDPGWGWRVHSRAGHWHGGDGFGAVTYDSADLQQHEGVVSGVAMATDGVRVHVRQRERSGVSVEVSAPANLIDFPLRRAMRSTLAALGFLAAALVAAALLQLRFTLRPLRQLREDVAKVRSGERTLLPDTLPAELAPLARELNALIAQNSAGLAHARNHVANLAHGLKTPLATLALGLARENVSMKLRQLVNDLDDRIDHHLGRARGAAVIVGDRGRVRVADVIGSLTPMMHHLYEDRTLGVACDVPASLAARIDRQDFDEMIGNLLDNACRHARSKVLVSARPDGAMLRLAIEDDGPGIPDDEIDVAVRVGTRLDETGRGYGFGLGITRELAELYGGALDLCPSSTLGGLRATLTLPRA